MPFSGPNDDKLPEHVQAMPADKRAQWASVWNDAFEQCQEAGGDDCEASAFRQANGVVTNTLITFRANLSSSSQTRRERLDGREYLVVPVVAAPEGVMNGALYSSSAWMRSLPSWNGRPITIDHPEKNGRPVSANSPDMTNVTIGNLYNVDWDGKLRGEMWLDVDKADRLGGAALEAVQRFENGQMVEVSTGLFGDAIEGSGQFNGRDFNAEIVNILPDHLAIILEGTGACSIQDGCGAPRVNRQGEPNMSENQEEQERQEGQPVTVNFNTAQAPDTEGLFNRLTCWLEERLGNGGHEGGDDPPEPAEPTTNADEGEGEGEGPNEQGEPTMSQELEALVNEFGGVGGLREVLTSARSVHVNQQEQREQIIAGLVANQRIDLSEEELGELSDGHLRQLQRLAQPVNYAGQGMGVRPNSEDEEWEYVAAPNGAQGGDE